MTPELTWISALAAGLYGAVALLCLFAAHRARIGKQPSKHVRQWIVIAAFFVLMIALRALLIEDYLEVALREWLKSNELYLGRRQIQIWLAVFLLIGTTGFFMWSVARARTAMLRRRTLALYVARMACYAMTALILARLVSLHFLDALLYGPIKINWLVDIGSSLAVAAMALFYASLVKMKR